MTAQKLPTLAFRQTVIRCRHTWRREAKRITRRKPHASQKGKHRVNTLFCLHPVSFKKSDNFVRHTFFTIPKLTLQNSIILKKKALQAYPERAILPEVPGASRRWSWRPLNRCAAPILHRGFPVCGKFFLRRGVFASRKPLRMERPLRPRLAALDRLRGLGSQNQRSNRRTLRMKSSRHTQKLTG